MLVLTKILIYILINIIFLDWNSSGINWIAFYVLLLMNSIELKSTYQSSVLFSVVIGLILKSATMLWWWLLHFSTLWHFFFEKIFCIIKNEKNDFFFCNIWYTRKLEISVIFFKYFNKFGFSNLHQNSDVTFDFNFWLGFIESTYIMVWIFFFCFSSSDMLCVWFSKE